VPPFYVVARTYLRLRLDAAAFLAAVERFADFLLRVAAAFLAAADRFVDVLFRAVDRLRPVDFLFLVAAAFRAAVERFADFLLRVAAAFLAAVDRFADVLLLRVAAMTHLLSGCQDAMRFRRRRSRSLRPPHTPYRSSRRSA
jgi:hypothetical protein